MGNIYTSLSNTKGKDVKTIYFVGENIYLPIKFIVQLHSAFHSLWFEIVYYFREACFNPTLMQKSRVWAKCYQREQQNLFIYIFILCLAQNNIIHRILITVSNSKLTVLKCPVEKSRVKMSKTRNAHRKKVYSKISWSHEHQSSFQRRVGGCCPDRPRDP